MSLGFCWTFCSTGKNQNLVIYIGPFSSALCGIDPHPNLCQWGDTCRTWGEGSRNVYVNLAWPGHLSVWYLMIRTNWEKKTVSCLIWLGFYQRQLEEHWGFITRLSLHGSEKAVRALETWGCGGSCRKVAKFVGVDIFYAICYYIHRNPKNVTTL